MTRMLPTMHMKVLLRGERRELRGVRADRSDTRRTCVSCAQVVNDAALCKLQSEAHGAQSVHDALHGARPLPLLPQRLRLLLVIVRITTGPMGISA